MVLLVLAAGCVPERAPQGPRLIQEVTLAPTEVLPTRFLSPTPPRLTPEIVSPLNNVTVDAQFVVVTPTLPPSKTPTPTPTFTPTPTITPTATMTNTSTATAFLLPTSELIALTAPVAVPNERICDSNWFFIQPRPDSCPLYPPNASAGVYQEFQNGTMIWVGSQDAIYVLFNDLAIPRWQVFRDFFDDGMAEESPDYIDAPHPTLWQPRRGFGLLWRDSAVVRNRIGWATQQWEEPYSVQVQTADNGSVFLNTPSTNVVALFPNGINWNRYSSDTLPSFGGTQIPALGPMPTLPPPQGL